MPRTKTKIKLIREQKLKELGFVPHYLAIGYRNDYHKEMYHIKKEIKQCYKCKNPVYEKDGRSFITCFYHYELSRDQSREKYREARDKGNCIRCWKRKAAENRKMCDKCRAYRSEHEKKARAKKREIKQCYKCTSTAVVYGYCVNCYVKRQRGQNKLNSSIIYNRRATKKE